MEQNAYLILGRVGQYLHFLKNYFKNNKKKN